MWAKVKGWGKCFKDFHKKIKFNIGKYFAKGISKSWKTQKLSITLEDLLKKLSKFFYFWLYVLVMSRAHFRVNPHSIVYLNVKELLAQSRHEIWSFSDCNWTRTQNHLVRKQTLNHLTKLAMSVPLWTKWFWVRV